MGHQPPRHPAKRRRQHPPQALPPAALHAANASLRIVQRCCVPLPLRPAAVPVWTKDVHTAAVPAEERGGVQATLAQHSGSRLAAPLLLRGTAATRAAPTQRQRGRQPGSQRARVLAAAARRYQGCCSRRRAASAVGWAAACPPDTGRATRAGAQRQQGCLPRAVAAVPGQRLQGDGAVWLSLLCSAMTGP